MSYRRGPSLVTDGLILYLDGANPKSYIGSGTTWFDLTRNKNNGTLVNGVAYNSNNKGSLLFDGTNDVVTNTLFYSGNNITVNLWCFPTTTGVFRTPITNMIFNNVMIGYAIQQRSNSTFWVTVGVWGVSGVTVQNIPYTVNNWINLTLTYNGSTVSGYRNGVLFGTTTSASTSFSGGSLLIGKGATNASEFFAGNISQVGIYDRPLSSSEVLQNYNATKGRYGL